jgi:hypothetical protein
MPDLLHRRLREELLPAPHAPTASGWSNSSRVGFFLLLDQDALSRRTAPAIYFVSFLIRLRSALGGNGILRSTALRSFLAAAVNLQKLLELCSEGKPRICVFAGQAMDQFSI